MYTLPNSHVSDHVFNFIGYINRCCLHSPQSNGIRQISFVWVCFSTTAPTYFVDIAIYVYLVILQLISIILCFQTRKVKVSSLNDSKYVASIIYISSIVLVMMILVNFTLHNFINILSGVFIGSALIMASLFLGLTFIPTVGIHVC